MIIKVVLQPATALLVLHNTLDWSQFFNFLFWPVTYEDYSYFLLCYYWCGWTLIYLVRLFLLLFFAQAASGSMDKIPTSGKHKSTRSVVLVLLLCVILTTFAFLTSIMCYFYRKEKCPVQAPVFSSDKEASSNSATNLISHKTFTMPATRRNISSPFNFFIGV